MNPQVEESDRFELLERPPKAANGAEDPPTVSGVGLNSTEEFSYMKRDALHSVKMSVTPRSSHQRSDSDEFWSPRADDLAAIESLGDRSLSGVNSLDSSWKAWAAAHPILVNVLRNLLYILLWYFFSISLTLYNNLLVGKEHGHFPAPLLMTTVHFFLQALFAGLLLKLKCGGAVVSKQISWRDYCTKIVPTGIATAMDIGLSNLSFVLITVPFYEMCKSSAPVFLLLFAFLFRLEKPSFKLLGVILVICVGELLTVAGESQFSHLGFILVMLSAVMAGFRWTITQILLQKEALGMTSPVVTLYYLAPVMAVSMGLWSFITEPWGKLSKSMYFDSHRHALFSAALMLMGGTLAFLMILTEFMVISLTSAVTFTVAGVVKEVATIVVSVIFLHDPFGLVNLAGLFVVILGVSLFNVIKYQKMQEKKLSHHGHGSSSARLLAMEEPLEASEYEMLPKAGGTEPGDGPGVGNPTAEQQEGSFMMTKYPATMTQDQLLLKMRSETWPYSPRLTSRSPRASSVRQNEDHDDKPG